jgi:hypothetical protein
MSVQRPRRVSPKVPFILASIWGTATAAMVGFMGHLLRGEKYEHYCYLWAGSRRNGLLLIKFMANKLP